jgi:hypothetical protein
MKNTNNSTLLSPIGAVNSTTGQWRVDPLPSNLTVFNSSVPDNITINGQLYNGSAINGTTIIVRFPSTNLGSISMASFIYMVMSLAIIGLMAFPFVQWVKDATSHISSRGQINSSRRLQRSFLSERKFERRLRLAYPNLDQQPQASYAERVPRKPGGTVTSQDLRECRELIRSKYALDVFIHNSRHVRGQNRDIIDDKRRQSAGALVDIQRTVRGWVEADARWSPEELVMVQMIYDRIQALVQSTAQVPLHHDL